jgi:transcriptional regulator with XRE-family HTH domain
MSINIDKSKKAVLIGERLKQARELCRMSQELSAKRLGYKNSSQLSKIESAFENRSIPIHKICDAAKLYGVSADFLLGLSDDWDIDEHHNRQINIANHLYDTWEHARKSEIVAINKMLSQVQCLERVVSDIVDDSVASYNALMVFMRRNSEFEDMPGGSALVKRITDAKERTNNAKAMLIRFHVRCGISTMTQSDVFTDG